MGREAGLRTASNGVASTAPAPAIDPRAAIQTELDTLREARSPQIKQGVTFRGNDSESGLGKITDVEAPLLPAALFEELLQGHPALETRETELSFVLVALTLGISMIAMFLACRDARPVRRANGS